MSTIANEITIAASAREIFDVASATERWPAMLPHYRYVHILAGDDRERTIEMAARRGIIPVKWQAIQRNDPSRPEITFTHTAGWTKGMEVVWRFDSDGARTRVTIVHELTFSFPIAASLIERHIVNGYFIDGVATRTLACMKAFIEGRSDG